MTLDLSHTVQHCGQFPAREVEGEGLVVSTATGEVIVLNGVAFSIWSWINGERTVKELLAMVCDHYDVGRDEAKSDLVEFLEALQSKALIALIQT